MTETGCFQSKRTGTTETILGFRADMVSCDVLLLFELIEAGALPGHGGKDAMGKDKTKFMPGMRIRGNEMAGEVPFPRTMEHDG